MWFISCSLVRHNRITMEPWCAYVRDGSRHASGEGHLDVARSNARSSESVAECSLHSNPRVLGKYGCGQVGVLQSVRSRE